MKKCIITVTVRGIKIAIMDASWQFYIANLHSKTLCLGFISDADIKITKNSVRT